MAADSSLEWVSARQAADILARRALNRRQARRVLDAGLAGPPVRTSAATLYERRRVLELVERMGVPADARHELCPNGVFVARRFFSVLAPRADQMEALRGGWVISPWTGLLLESRIARQGPMPFVATIGGFVALGANLTGFWKDGDRSGLILRAPGPWFEAFERHRLSTWSGNAWQLVDGKPWKNRAP
jgi:hypothetical protein